MLLLAHGSYYLGWTIDDPYISYRYAENLAHGHGLVFNIGAHVEGYSNFLYTLILAGFQLAGLSPVSISRLLGFLSALFLLWLLFHAIQKTPARNSELPFVLFFPLYLLALNGSLALWSVSGMETGFYTLLVAFAWLALIKADTRGSVTNDFSCGLLFLLVALERPEGVLFFTVCLAADVFRIVADKESRAQRRTQVFARALVFLVPYAAYNLWRVSYYHSLFPNTFYAKATGDSWSRLLAGVTYLFQFVSHNGSFLFVLVVFPFLSVRSAIVKQASTNLQSAIQRSLEFILAGLVFVIYAGGDWMPLWRFMTPILPMIFYLLGLGLGELWRRLKSGDTEFRRRDFAFLAIIVLLLLSLWQERRLTSPMMQSLRDGTFYQPNVLAGDWLKEHTPPAARIAGEEAGIIPYYSERYFIDMIGITDPHIARLPGGLHQKTDVHYLLNQKPDYVVLICKMDGPDLQKLQALFPSGQELLAQPGFTEAYQPMVTFPRGNERLGFSQLVVFKRK